MASKLNEDPENNDQSHGALCHRCQERNYGGVQKVPIQDSVFLLSFLKLLTFAWCLEEFSQENKSFHWFRMGCKPEKRDADIGRISPAQWSADNWQLPLINLLYNSLCTSPNRLFHLWQRQEITVKCMLSISIRKMDFARYPLHYEEGRRETISRMASNVGIWISGMLLS